MHSALISEIKRRLNTFFPIFISLMIVGCSIQENNTHASPTIPPSPIPSSTVEILPDLVIKSVSFLRDSDELCSETNNKIQITIENAGAGGAGPFAVKLNDTLQNVIEGLQAGEERELIFSDINTENDIFVDALQKVVESNEDNNQVSKSFALPSLSPECLPTLVEEKSVQEATSTLIGHTAKVWSLDFTPDGSLLASGSVDNTLRLWRVREATLLRTMQGHPFPILTLAFSPNGLNIATGSDDGLIRMWQVSNASLQMTLRGHAGWVNSVAFSPDGRTLASGSDDFTVRIWRTIDGKLLHTVDEGMARILDLTYSPDGLALAWGESNGTVRVWNTSERNWIAIFKEIGDAITSVAYSTNGDFLAAGSMDGKVIILDMISKDVSRIIKRHNGAVLSVAFSPDGNFFASASDDNEIHLWRANEITSQGTRPLVTYSGHTGAINTIVFSPDGSILASASDDNTIRLWDVPAIE
jgi:WD40 repeat protein